jgi:hypothetical protein
VWVKRDGEGDEKALKVLVVPSADVSDLISVLYKEPYFAFIPGTIDCLLVRGEDGIAPVVSNRDAVDPSAI